MVNFRVVLNWLFMLTKRLYKKPTFLAILLIIPLAAMGYSLATKDNGGMVSIALSSENPADAFTASMINEFVGSSKVIRFVIIEDSQVARNMVYDGAVDAAWIVDSDLQEQITDYVAGTYDGDGFVSVVMRQESVPLMLCNEKLSSRLFVECARACFLEYIRQNAPELVALSDEKILSYFDSVQFDDGLFSFSYVDSVHSADSCSGYLLLPVRGILAILLIVGGIASAMFFTNDDDQGLFSWLNISRKPHIELGYHFVVLVNLSVAVLLSLAVCGVFTSVLREIISMLMYILCCSVFCRLLRLWCGNLRTIAIVLPVLTVLLFAVCPVFISLPGLEVFRMLLPPTYYLNSIYNWLYLLYMLIYTCCLEVLYIISAKILRRS